MLDEPRYSVQLLRTMNAGEGGSTPVVGHSVCAFPLVDMTNRWSVLQECRKLGRETNRCK